MQKIKYVKIGSLKVHPNNPRVIKDEQFKKLCESIKEDPDYFEARPCLVNKAGVIFAGNQRYKAAQELGLKQVPVIVMDNPALEAKRMLRDNMSAGEWDFNILSNQFDQTMLTEVGFDLSSFPEPEVGAVEGQDDAPEMRKTKIKAGDMFALGEHRLLCGSAVEDGDSQKLMGKEKAVCVFTDPPYGVSIGKKNAMLNTFQPAGRCLDNLVMDDIKPAELGDMLLKAFTLWRGRMADNCSVFVCSPQGGGLGMMMMMMKDAGLEVRHIINWVKNSPTFSMGRLDYDYQHEPILFTWTKTHKRKKTGAFQTSLWAVDKPRACDLHPTMKPVELPECAILNHTDKKDIVVDMFGGSGTTLIAAEKTGRRCYMIELNPIYCQVIIDRWEKFTNKKAIKI